ncbi:hypothetical protein [Hyphomicrobium sp.]|uniref:hypothetical protein n=1 Tax=Hyphomicrobium sp. TaxID=82 RepID=UPI002E343BE2|nr:hypothetical protein [Hyphomicrobium sp.]HEX2842648.1 hypothetical protein [Hyphomicrobium sp.]
MGSYIPRLARIRSGNLKSGRCTPHSGDLEHEAPVNVERLTRLVPQIRKRLAIGRPFSDAALLASLVAIARHPSHEARWRAAESSTLGQYLASSVKDRSHALVTILSMLPKPHL